MLTAILVVALAAPATQPASRPASQPASRPVTTQRAHRITPEERSRMLAINKRMAELRKLRTKDAYDARQKADELAALQRELVEIRDGYWTPTTAVRRTPEEAQRIAAAKSEGRIVPGMTYREACNLMRSEPQEVVSETIGERVFQWKTIGQQSPLPDGTYRVTPGKTYRIVVKGDAVVRYEVR